MIVTERFIFVHMHKTGGQTINKIIARCIADNQVIGYHYPHSLRPQKYTHLPIVGFARNPWDWYVSWYAFNRRPKARNALFAICSDGGKAGFKTTVTNLVNLGDNSSRSLRYRDALISVLPTSLRGNRGIGLTKDCVTNFNDNDTAYCSWLFQRMLGVADEEQVHIGKFENLSGDFIEILTHLGVKQTSGIEHALSRTRHINASSRSHYSHYYDDELRGLIARKDNYLIDRFDYSYEQKPTIDKVIKIPSTNSIDGSFRKLGDNVQNFLPLRDGYDVEQILKALNQVPADQWAQSDRENQYRAHSQTQSLLLVHDDDMRHRDPTYHDLYESFAKELSPLLEIISAYYGNDGYFIRILFARLLAGRTIMPHIDFVFSLLHCHRIHVPIITNDKVLFLVGGETRNMKIGEVCEINNATVHSVANNGDESRTHLIIDWAPNSILRAMDERPSSTSSANQH